MPRIVPLQLLKCLRVLLNDQGGILSSDEVKRIEGLMTKYSKKLVSKCIYVQILKSTKTELLDDFMAVGGWNLVYTWLNDGIRAMNWPLVQEILELLLLCPVDVHRLKLNAAPKTVKTLSKEGGNEGVRILAQRLVDQWLNIVTQNQAATNTTSGMTSDNKSSGTVAPTINTVAQGACTAAVQKQTTKTTENSRLKARNSFDIKGDANMEQDPLGDVTDASTNSKSFALTAAQKKANQTGLVYKIVVKDGQQLLAKVAKSSKSNSVEDNGDVSSIVDETDDMVTEEDDAIDEEETVSSDTNEETEERILLKSSSQSKQESGSSSDEETTGLKSKGKTSGTDEKKAKERKLSNSEVDKLKSSSKKEHRSSIDSKDAKERDKSKERKSVDKEKSSNDKERKSSSSSSSHKSSSHKSSSSSSTKSSSSSSSATSKSKSTSSSSSSSHRSSSDKHRSDKDRSTSSSKEKERKEGSSSSSNSSSNKHKHSSSSSSSSSKEKSASSSRHHDKNKEKSSSSSSSTMKKDKEREREIQAEKDKETLNKVSPPSLDKLGKIPKKAKEVEDDAAAAEANKPTSITIPSKKASMSIEIRRDTEKAKTVKTYNSKFRSHGLNEEAPPPPSRKGLKKPVSTTPGSVIPTSLPSSLKRPSPPRETSTEKKVKIDINNVSNIANEKPGSIKLIPPKKKKFLPLMFAFEMQFYL